MIFSFYACQAPRKHEGWHRVFYSFPIFRLVGAEALTDLCIAARFPATITDIKYWTLIQTIFWRWYGVQNSTLLHERTYRQSVQIRVSFTFLPDIFVRIPVGTTQVLLATA